MDIREVSGNGVVELVRLEHFEAGRVGWLLLERVHVDVLVGSIFEGSWDFTPGVKLILLDRHGIISLILGDVVHGGLQEEDHEQAEDCQGEEEHYRVFDDGLYEIRHPKG